MNEEIGILVNRCRTETKFPSDLALEIDGKGTNKLWKIFRNIKGNEAYEELRELVKYGINQKFDIRSIIHSEVERFPAYGLVKVRRKLHLPMRDFDDEMELRQDIMIQVILGAIDESATVPVGGKDGQ